MEGDFRDHFHAFLLILLAVALLTAVFKIRLYTLKVQDRVIRLEERLRLTQLLAEPLRSRIPELTESQLCGLRFASDAEIPKLVERALNQKLSRADIKKARESFSFSARSTSFGISASEAKRRPQAGSPSARECATAKALPEAA